MSLFQTYFSQYDDMYFTAKIFCIKTRDCRTEMALSCTLGSIYKTGFKLMVTLQSGCVPEILALCRIDVIFFKKYHVKALEQSFPMMYNTI